MSVAFHTSSTGTLFGASDIPVFDRSGTVAPFCDATGKWLPLCCFQNCTGVAQEVRYPAAGRMLLP